MARLQSRLFEVSPVERGERPLPLHSLDKSMQAALGPVLVSDDPDRLVVVHPSGQSLLMAAHLAYQHHFPLVLSPDVIWQTLLQGVSRWVNRDPERYRGQLVTFPGRLGLLVREDRLARGHDRSVWQDVVLGLGAQMDRVLTPVARALADDYSGTTLNERLAARVVLMETTGAFFDYELDTMCGIPMIKLLGSEEDWLALASRVGRLTELGMGSWAASLRPLVAEFARAYRGEVARTFWQNLYKIGTYSSGSPFFNGWLMAFFPFITCEFSGEQRENPLIGEDLSHYFRETLCSDRDDGAWGFGHSQMPDGLARVDLLWKLPDQTVELELVAGALGVEQDPATLAVRPRVSWAVRRKDAPPPLNNHLDYVECYQFFASHCDHQSDRSRPLSQLDSL